MDLKVDSASSEKYEKQLWKEQNRGSTAQVSVEIEGGKRVAQNRKDNSSSKPLVCMLANGSDPDQSK